MSVFPLDPLAHGYAISLHYDAAFGACDAETLFGTTISRPEEVTVLCYAGRTMPDHVHLTSYFCDQVWAFHIIKACALKRYMCAVRVLLRPHTCSSFLGNESILGHPDVADMIVACLAVWHASLPHEDALPRGPRWRGFA